MAIILDGKKTSAAVREQVRLDVAELTEKTGIVPGLAVILVGNNPASQIYVRNKHRACKEAGIRSFEYTYPADLPEEELLKKIDELNRDSAVHGILVQLPLPKHISTRKVIEAIAPEKDVDAFGDRSVGKICGGDFRFAPCTPAGVMDLLDTYGIEIEGKKAVVVGRSNIVGKPMAMLLLHRNATVTVCHSKTRDLASETKNADIVVCAVGKEGFRLGKEYFREGAVVVDVSINRTPEGLCGDVLFDEVEPIASYITPVPGGVGPMTIAELLKNTLAAARLAGGER